MWMIRNRSIFLLFQIKENDGLPQIVCMRCLGTLEFLCDFYDRCHLTQDELQETSPKDTVKGTQEEKSFESDKENVVPPVINTKQKSKTPSSESLKNGTSSLAENNVAQHRVQKKGESENQTDQIQAKTKKTMLSLNNIVRKSSPLNNVTANENLSPNDQTIASTLRNRKNILIKKENSSEKTVLRITRSMNDSSSSEKNIVNNSTNIKVPLRRKRGRKSKLEKMREAILLASMKKEMSSDFDEQRENSFTNENKRQCLRTISSNIKSNGVMNNTLISSKSQTELIAKEQVVLADTLLNKAYNENKETNTEHSKSEIANISREAEINKTTVTEVSDRLSLNIEHSTEKSKPISVIVKQEKAEVENDLISQNGKSNQFVWIPNEMLIQKRGHLINDQKHGQVDQENDDSPQIIFPLNKDNIGIEEKKIDRNSEVANFADGNDRKSAVFTEQNRVTVIKSPESTEITDLDTTDDDPEKLFIALDTNDHNAKADLDFTIKEPSSQGFSHDNSFDGSKNKDRSFGKISELISDEQKQAIETYYTVNMSNVNSEEVQKNITIVDKKNVRCNICGSLYLRLDKCQVHIWGHLQMKPYQCKACDFATVTVSNVRCHIRKSHLKIKPFACHLCEKRYVTAVLLEEHINTHTGARPYKCKVCDFASSSRQMLNYHKSTHKPVKDINCKICGKEFYSRGRLRAHMIVHNKDKVVVCKLCSAYLSNAEALETHYKNVHMQDYICNICGKRVKSRKALHNHQNVHAAAKYKCTLCPNVYKSSQILKEHLLKHEGIRKYKCNICEKTFGQQSHLAAHMAVHSKIRFHCPGCDKPFNRHDNMKIHTKRCKLFLANPELKNLITKRERTISFNNITELTAELKTRDVANSTPYTEDQIRKTVSSIKTMDDQEKAPINVCQLGLNISCIESRDKTWDSDMYKENNEIATSAELNVIKITNITDTLLSESDNLSVLENVLGPESY